MRAYCTLITFFSLVLFLSSTIKTYHSLLQCRLFSLRGIANIQEDLVQKNNVGINRGYVPLWGTTSIQEGFLWKIMWTFVIACVLSTNILILFIYVSSITISTLLIQLKCALVPLEEVTSAPVSVTVELPLTTFGLQIIWSPLWVVREQEQF